MNMQFNTWRIPKAILQIEISTVFKKADIGTIVERRVVYYPVAGPEMLKW